MNRRFALSLAGCAAATLVAAAPAAAAPQILGLTASNGPIPLRCDAAACSAEFSSFCLQETRPMPEDGTPYEAANAGRLTVVVTDASGQTLRLPGSGLVDIASARGYAAVTLTIQKARLAGLGAAGVAIDIGPDVSLVPTALGSDPNPQSSDEIALAVGPLRRAAARFFETPSPPADAAQLVNAMINALPAGATLTAANGIWQQAQLARPAAARDARGATMAEALLEYCSGVVAAGLQHDLRHCLKGRHDSLMIGSNQRFWEASGGY